MSKYSIEEIRKKLKETTGKSQDPDLFRPKAAEGDAVIKYYFYILPPYGTGDQLKTGKATHGIDQFFVQHGVHWINNRPYACPNINDKEDCPFCKQANKLLKGVTDKETRSAIAKQWLPNVNYMVNIYFPDIKQNPEEYKNRVMFYNAPKTVMDMWQACLMADDANVEIDPQAYGIFFDEEASFLFELASSKQGKSNSYTKSKFIPNNGIPKPIANTPERIKEILSMRHDLKSKIQASDPKALERLVDELLHGDTASDSGFDSDETKTPVQKSASQFISESGDLESEITKTVTASKKQTKSESKPEPKTELKQEAKVDDDDDLESLLAGLSE